MRNLVVGCVAFGALLAGGSTHAGDWIRAESPHFIVTSDALPQTAIAYIQKLEAFRGLTNTLTGDSDATPRPKFELTLLSDGREMQTVRTTFAAGVGGVYFNCAEGASAFGALQPVKPDGQDPTQLVLFHEYSHYVMYQHATISYPMWYAEGYAEYLSTAAPQKDTITVGEPAKGRVAVLAKDRWIDFRKILEPGFGFTGDKQNDPWEVQSFYAQSWILTHYMLSDPQRAARLDAYFHRVSDGEDPIAAWQPATGIALDDLYDVLTAYQKTMPSHVLPMTEPDADAISITPIDEAQGRVLFDASLMQTCLPPDQGQQVLTRLQAAGDSLRGQPLYDLALARAELLYGNPVAAQAPLQAMLKADPTNFEAGYLLGRVYARMAQIAPAAEAGALHLKARALFTTAYAQKPLDAPNLYFLARTYAPDDKAALDAANQAHKLAPGVLEYATLAASTDLAAGERDQAAAVLLPFVSDPHNQLQSGRIQSAIAAIHEGVPVADVVRILADIQAQ